MQPVNISQHALQCCINVFQQWYTAIMGNTNLESVYYQVFKGVFSH